ncbi:hypothetical protein ACFLXV_00650 [Chloroflexota bacterium]
MSFQKVILAIVIVSLWASLLHSWIDWFDSEEPGIDTAVASSVNQTAYSQNTTGYSQAPVYDSMWTTTSKGPDDTYASLIIEDTGPVNDGIRTSSNHPATYTPVGNDVVISLPGLVVAFDTVLSDGISSIIWSSETPKNTTIPDYAVMGDFIDITTTATYSRNILIGFRYSENIDVEEDYLRLSHWNGNGWEDVTAWVDSKNNIIYGEVDSLSWFFIGGQWVWIGDSVPVLASTSGKILYLADVISDVWITTTASAKGDCEMGSSVNLEVSACGQRLWSMWESIMLDSVVSWKYWMPALVDVTEGLTVTNAD